MRIFTGDECGLIKECIPELSRKKEDKNAPAAPFGAMPNVALDGVCRLDPKEPQTRSRGVTDMVFLTEDTESEEASISIAALRQNGSVELWEGSASKPSAFGSYDKLFATKNVFDNNSTDGAVKPLALGAFEKQSKLCAVDTLGNLSVLNLRNGNIVANYNAYSTSKQGNTISYTPGKTINTQLATAAAFDPTSTRVAVGGRERETTLLDLNTGKIAFKAKNLPPDPQTLLQQPVWPSSILFMQDPNVMAVGTAYKQVRLYDVRESTTSRRPTATTPEGLLEYRVTCMCQVQEQEIVAGDAGGYIYSLDLRTLGRNPKSAPQKNMGRYAGPAGSVRQLKKHPTLPRLAAVGLDRMLRIYDTDKRKQLDCVYLKQRLNCVLFGNDDTWDDGNTPAIGSDDEEMDQEDVVQDYVDSDDEGKDLEQSNEESEDDSGVEDGDESEDSNDEVDSEDEEGSMSEDDESEHSQSPDDTSDDEGSSDEPVVEAEDSSEEEEVVIKAPKRRRRR